MPAHAEPFIRALHRAANPRTTPHRLADELAADVQRVGLPPPAGVAADLPDRAGSWYQVNHRTLTALPTVGATPDPFTLALTSRYGTVPVGSVAHDDPWT